MMVYPEGIHYVGMTPDDIPYLVEEHFLKGRVVERFREVVKPIVDEELGALRPKEVRVVLRNCGQIDPNNIEELNALLNQGYKVNKMQAMNVAPAAAAETVFMGSVLVILDAPYSPPCG